MRALYLTQPGKVEIQDVDVPTPNGGEVRLRVEMVGLCGGDLNAFRGTFPLQEYPVILGHEIGAVVDQVGENVPTKIRPGMRVAVEPYENCGQCTSCKNNRPNACKNNRTMGVRRSGAMTRYITVPWEKVHASDTLDVRELALVEPLSVGFHAAERGRVTSEDTVAVVGCGTVGQGAILRSSGQGAKVIAVDIDDTKLEIARRAGANHSIHSSQLDLHEALSKLTQGQGPNVIIEAVGKPATFRAAVEEAAYGGRVVYVGYAKDPVSYDSRQFVEKELDILGSRNSLGEFPFVIAMLEKGGFPVDDVITRIVPLEGVESTLIAWDQNTRAVNKIMVDLAME